MSESIKVKVRNESHHDLPFYATSGSSGADVRAYLNEDHAGYRLVKTLNPLNPDIEHTIVTHDPESNASFLYINPGVTYLIPTGLFLEIPEGYEMVVRPRSGASVKGLIIVNSPGTIDSDYRGQLFIAVSSRTVSFKITDGMQIAQLIIQKYDTISWIPSGQLSDTTRGHGGFGSTDKTDKNGK